MLISHSLRQIEERSALSSLNISPKIGKNDAIITGMDENEFRPSHLCVDNING